MAHFRLLLLGLASGSALYSGIASALGLGEITLHSALNQPLDADIELFQVGDLSEDEIKVRLASEADFGRAGVERFYFLNDLRFVPMLSGGRSHIRVRSNKPVREPYLNFIIEVARPGGNLLREYTVLIDPPGSSAYAPQAAPEAQPTVSARRPEPPRPLPAAANGQRYQVQRGDSLWTIAGRLQAGGATASREALMSDIHALNPQAFANNDPSQLRAGVQLTLPDSAAPAAPAEPPAISQATSGPTAMETAPVPAESVEEPAQVQAEQARVTAELAAVNAQNEQLRSSLSELQEQLRLLQEQMADKDLQMQQIRSQLQQQPPAIAPPAAPASSPVVESRSGGWSFWLAGGLLLMLLVVAVGWALRRHRTPPTEPVHRRPEPVRPPVVEVAPRNVATVASRPQSGPTPVPRPVVPHIPLPEIDPLEGANIYIAYGRFADAASSLRKAVAQQPDRLDLRLRLLEVCGELGDASAFFEQERQLHEMGASHVQVDQIRARYPHLQVPKDSVVQFAAPEEHQAEPPVALQDDFQLNLDDLSLDADWGLSSPFEPEPSARAKAGKQASPAFDPDFSSNLQELPEVSEMHDDELLDSFAELPQERVLGDDSAARRQPAALFEPLVSDFEQLAGNRDHLVRLNMALAYIEQGDIGSACDILNELISSGDEQQREQARELLAKIA